MCGICGVLHFDERSPSVEILSLMAKSLHHRGPDAKGIHIDGSIGLGHSRLAIIDLSSAGKQPMTNEDGSLWLVYNGEIYNYLEIREELIKRGHIFRSHTDSEVILHSYETWGYDSLLRFNGMFAFGLWDSNRRRLWLVRDRLGIKPLFFTQLSDRFLFSSEIKAILCDPVVERRIDYTALHHFLSLNYTPAPYTLFDGIRQLLPGQYMVVDENGSSQEEFYWDVSYARMNRMKESEQIEVFEDKLAEAVKKRLISDVPLGAFLSGGVDSSTIVYWMAREVGEGVKTFSIGFKEKSYSELDYAERVANACKTDHTASIITPDAVEILPKIVWHAEEPTADSSMLPLYYLSQMTRKNVTVALSGDGADEILAGYETYQAYYAAQLYRLIPLSLRRNAIQPVVEKLPASEDKISLDFKLKRFVQGAELDPDAAHAYWRVIFDENAKRALYTSEISQRLRDIYTVDLYREVFKKNDTTNPVDRMLYVDTRFYLPNDMLVKIDRMSMAHSLEVRVPFLDHTLVEYIASLPSSLKLRRWLTKKYLLKASIKRHLPGVKVQMKKQGFNIPKGIWFKGELRDYIYDHLSTSLIREMGLFNPQQVTALLNEHINNEKDNSHQIWGLLYLSLWWQIFVKKSIEVKNKEN